MKAGLGGVLTCTALCMCAASLAKTHAERGRNYFVFMDNRELDLLSGCSVSNAIPGLLVRLRSVCIFETDPNRYHRGYASRTRFPEAVQQIATGRLRRHRRETLPGRIHSKSFSFRSVLLRSSYQSFFSNESGMFIFLSTVFKQPAIPLYVERT